MSNITSSQAYIQIPSAQQRSAVSEFLVQTLGGAVNWLNDQIAAIATNSFLKVPSSTAMTVSSFSFSTIPAGQMLIGNITTSGATGVVLTIDGVNQSVTGGASFVIFGGQSFAFSATSGSPTLKYALLSNTAITF